MIKNRFASKKDIKTDFVNILQTLMLTKKRQGVCKKVKKELRLKSSLMPLQGEKG